MAHLLAVGGDQMQWMSTAQSMSQEYQSGKSGLKSPIELTMTSVQAPHAEVFAA